MLFTFFTHVFSFPRYILTFRNSLDPASLLKTKRKRIRTQRSQDCLPSENIYRRQKHQPHPKTPRHLPLGCRPFDDCLSRWTLQETETFEEGEEDLKPSFTFWRARSPAVSWFRAQSSQDYLSYPPAYSLRGREKALSNKYEKLVVSRLENLA